MVDWSGRTKLDEWFEDVLGMPASTKMSEIEWERPTPSLPSSPLEWGDTARVLVFCLMVQAALAIIGVVLQLTVQEKRVHFFRIVLPSDPRFNVAFVFDCLQLSCSFLSCGLFILQSYRWRGMGDGFVSFDIALQSIIILHYACRWAHAPAKAWFVWMPTSVLDTFAVTSTIVTPMVGGWLPFSFLRSAQVALSLEHIFKVVNFSEFTEKLSTILVQLLALIFGMAGLIYMLEMLGDPPFLGDDASDQNFSFFRSCYFILVTISTVGYGDYSPNSTISRLVCMCSIVVGVVFFGINTSQMTSIMADRNLGRGRFNKGNNAHIVVTGDVDPHVAANFLRELYHEDHRGHPMHNAKVCILTSPDYQPAMREKVDKLHRSHKVECLSGSPLDDDDLKRCMADEAEAIFILIDPQATKDTQRTDTENILRALAFKEFCPEKVQVYLELFTRENIDLIEHEVTQVVCLSDVKMGLAARSCICPGFSTLLANLVFSSSAEIVPSGWKSEYLAGAGHELYDCRVPKRLANVSFGALVLELYNRKHILLVGYQNPTDNKIVINPPHGTLIPPKAVALFVAPSAVSADVLERLDVEHMLRSASLASATTSSMATMKPVAVPLTSAPAATSPPSRRRVHRNRVTPTEKPEHTAEMLAPHLKKLEEWTPGDEALAAVAAASPVKMATTPHNHLTPLAAVKKGPVVTDTIDSMLERLALPATGVKNHMLVLGIGVGMEEFFRIVNAAQDRPFRSIVVVHDGVPDEDLVRAMVAQTTPRIYFVRGAPYTPSMLERCHVWHSKRVVCFSQKVVGNVSRAMEDAGVIFTMRWLRARFTTTNFVPVVVELSSESNIKFLSPGQNQSDDGDFETSEEYASGQVLPCCFDTVLLCQCLYKPIAVSLVSSLMASNEQSGGRVVHHMDPPAELGANPKYRDVLAYLLFSCDVLLLGLYRRHADGFQYVSTTPAPDDTVGPTDKLFVLTND